MTAMAPFAGAVRASGDAEAIALRDRLRQFVDSRLRDRSENEDIVQETYLRFYDYRRRRAVANVGAFCFTVARNLVWDHLRRARAAPPQVDLSHDLACPQPLADTVLDYRQRVEILTQVLKRMPPLRREVFMRRRLDGLPIALIATDLELSVAAVEKHCTRALVDLRVALERRGLPAGGAR